MIIGVDASDRVLHQLPQFLHLKIAPHIACNDVGGIDFYGTNGIPVKSGGYVEIFKIIGVVCILIRGVGELELTCHIIQIVPLNIHIHMPFKDGDAVVDKIKLL